MKHLALQAVHGDEEHSDVTIVAIERVQRLCSPAFLFEGKDCHAHSAKAELNEPADRELAVDVDHVAKGKEDENTKTNQTNQTINYKNNYSNSRGFGVIALHAM